MSFFIYIYKNCDLVLAYKANIAIFLFLQLDCICWHQDLYWIWLFLICITCGALRQRNFHWELRFLTQAREIYGKSIIILFMYKINQTETDTADGSYSHKYNFKWPTPHSHGTDTTFHSISGYGHFTPYENDDHFCPSIYSWCFTCLILNCTSGLQVTSFHFHFA